MSAERSNEGETTPRFAVEVIGHGRHELPADALTELLETLGVVKPRCHRGVCGACRVQLVHGQVASTQPMLALSPKQRSRGCILPCVAVLESSAVIAPDNACTPAPRHDHEP